MRLSTRVSIIQSLRSTSELDGWLNQGRLPNVMFSDAIDTFLTPHVPVTRSKFAKGNVYRLRIHNKQCLNSSNTAW